MTTDLRPRLQESLGSAYTLERELGGGGMSRTYVATEAALGRKVVVKILSPELAAGVSVDRFNREIQLAAALQHPHIVPVLNAGEAGGLPWFTMPYVEGESLRARLGRGPVRIGEITGILRDVARALEFAHGHGIVHRDIKPDNVLLAGSSATVTDFGIAKALSVARTLAPGGTLTVAGTSIGTPTYMAPEQAAGDANLDHRSDIYSFGIMAYELLAGHPPFQGATPVKIVTAHFSEKPRDIREVRLDTPPALAEMVMRCLEKDADARPQSATDLVRVLDTVTSSGTAEAAPVILRGGKIKVARAVGLWASATALVALTAWAATAVIGLPDWVLPGSLGVMLAGLPVIGLTWYVQRTAQRAYTATPTFTPGGSPSVQGTLATMAMKASPHVSWQRTWMGGAIAVGAFVILVVGFMVLRALGIGPAGSLIGAGKLSREEPLIVTDFQSPAEDSTLGLTITEALRADLAQSSSLRVVPRLAVIDALRLMQRPVNTRMDYALAREIATREGVKAVLDGNIVSLGGRYVISTRLVSAQSGDQLAAFREEASSQNDLIPAIGRLSKQLRTKVGESLKSVHEAAALDRVTTGSIDALRKYAAANLLQEQTGDYSRVNPMLIEAVTIDSTFAMAWRRLANNLSNIFLLDSAKKAITQAYRYRDRLSEVEKQLTIASYYQIGDVDEEKALAAYQAVLARDSLNFIALNNASLTLANRREFELATQYRIKAAAQPGSSPITWNNAVAGALVIGAMAVAESLQKVWVARSPTNPQALTWPARFAYQRRDYDGAERLLDQVRPQLASNRGGTIALLGQLSNVVLVRGRAHESATLQAEQRERQSQAGERRAALFSGMDSVGTAAVVLEDKARAQAILRRTVERSPLDSIPLLNRPYDPLLRLAAVSGEATLARQWNVDIHRQWAATGKTVDRPAWELYDDGLLALAEGKPADALARFDDADRRLLPCLECLAVFRFLALDRLQRADSAIATGEAYLKLTVPARLGWDALYLPGMRQRLGELYEAKGNAPKAIEHYQAFVDLWKNADSELQPRVRDVRGRIDRLRAAMAKKG